MNPENSIAIKARGLTRRFGKLTAVDGLDLDVPSGQIYGFLGPNGSGKSTTIRMLCGLLTPSAGQIDVLGLSIPRDAEALKPKIGYMTQKFSLYSDLNVFENLQFISEVYSLPRGERRQRIQEMLDRYDLIDQSKQAAGTLSGGQKQRLALAAATIHAPRLLLLDEPTSAVDPKSRRDFWESLFELASKGTTILVSTHYMDEAERCHRLAILDRGVKVADGSPAELGEEIDMQVYWLETNNPNRTRRSLMELPELFSITQLGLSLRVLVPKSVADARNLIERKVRAENIQIKVTPVTPNLEDVFVAVTQLRQRRAEVA